MHLTLDVCSATTFQSWAASGPEPLPNEATVRPDRGTFQRTSVPMSSTDGATWKVAGFEMLATGPAC